MPRPKFTPDKDQSRALAALAKLAGQQVALAEKLDEAIAGAARRDIPVAVIAETLGWQRKTVYRHLGHDM